jgi:hypothetical protein
VLICDRCIAGTTEIHQTCSKIYKKITVFKEQKISNKQNSNHASCNCTHGMINLQTPTFHLLAAGKMYMMDFLNIEYLRQHKHVAYIFQASDNLLRLLLGIFFSSLSDNSARKSKKPSINSLLKLILNKECIHKTICG